MEATQKVQAVNTRTGATLDAESICVIETHLDHARPDSKKAAERAAIAFQRVEAIYIVLAILAALAFLYASTVPLVFAVPDFDSRLEGVRASWHWSLAQPLDPVANVLAFIPLGFLWAAAWCASPSNRRPRANEIAPVAIGCLILATTAEVLQFWIPLRDPSLRDIFALECGALFGCGLWLATGDRLTTKLCRLAERLAVSFSRFARMRVPTLIIGTFVASLLLVIFANPVRLFLAYRDLSISLQHIALSRPNLGPPWPQGLVDVLWVSGVTAVLLIAACLLGRAAVRTLKARRLD